MVVQPVEMAAYPTEHNTVEAEEVRNFELPHSSKSSAGAFRDHKLGSNIGKLLARR